jgi:hypothetical protein
VSSRCEVVVRFFASSTQIFFQLPMVGSRIHDMGVNVVGLGLVG